MSFSSLNSTSGGPGIQIGGGNDEEEFCPILPPPCGNERPSLQGPRDSEGTNPETDDANVANKHPIQRSQSEQNAESLSQAKKSLLRVYSVVEYGPSSGNYSKKFSLPSNLINIKKIFLKYTRANVFM